jgi:hypothetical protein
MNRRRISRTLITAAACACRAAELTGAGYRTRMPRHHRGPAGLGLLVVVTAVLTALGVPGVSQPVALTRAAGLRHRPGMLR